MPLLRSSPRGDPRSSHSTRGLIRRASPAAALLVALAACSSGSTPASPAPTSSAPSPAPTSASPSTAGAGLAGAYRTDAGHQLLVVDASGVLLDTGDGSVRLTSPDGDGWDVGSALGQAQPVTGRLTLDPLGELRWQRAGAGLVTARRVDLSSRDLTVPVAGATVAATITEPAGSSTAHRRPGLVVVHEGGPRVRADVDLWARFWAASGFVVLTYDKRGEGASTGTFPGDDATATVVDTLAADVVAAAHVLRAQPEVEGSRLVLVGHSQAGWVAPAAADTPGSGVTGLLLMSGSATDGATEDAFDALTSNSTVDPGLTPAQVAARLAGVHGEYDPAATLRALRVPSLWIYGGRDQAVPAAQAAAAVRRQAPRAHVVSLARGDHFLYDTVHGTFGEEPDATRYAPGLFPLLESWAATSAA